MDLYTIRKSLGNFSKVLSPNRAKEKTGAESPFTATTTGGFSLAGQQ